MNIAVSAISFCKNQTLRSELLDHFPNTKFIDSKGVPNQDDLIAFYENANGIIVGTEKIDQKLLKCCLEEKPRLGPKLLRLALRILKIAL